MTITTRRIQNAAVEAGGVTVGKVDDVFFDVRTGEVTHVSVALSGWFRGTVVLVPVDPSGVQYANRRLHIENMSADEVRQAPLLDEESAMTNDTAQLLAMYQDTAPCWSFNGRCCATTTRSESIQRKTGEPALWASRDLVGAAASSGVETEIGRVEGLVIDDEAWRVTHVTIRHGHWYRHRSSPISMAGIIDVKKHDDMTTVVLDPVAAQLAA